MNIEQPQQLTSVKLEGIGGLDILGCWLLDDDSGLSAGERLKSPLQLFLLDARRLTHLLERHFLLLVEVQQHKRLEKGHLLDVRIVL